MINKRKHIEFQKKMQKVKGRKKTVLKSLPIKNNILIKISRMSNDRKQIEFQKKMQKVKGRKNCTEKLANKR